MRKALVSVVAGLGVGSRLAVTFLLAAVATTTSAYMGTAFDTGAVPAPRPALGIDDEFGRWNTSIQLVYDPDGAPSQFSNSKMLSLIEQATAQWEKVSGIKFKIVGIDPNAPDDRDLSTSQRDGLVRIFWAKSTGFAGLAGPLYGNYDQNLGYYPYADGDVKLNDDPAAWDSDLEMVITLTHEFGHLIGLGHSENPLSIMYADPYNDLSYPREDDIRAAQTLYGAGSNGIDPAAGVSEWRYSVPPAAQASATQYLFKPNEFQGSKAAYLFIDSAQTTTLAAITDTTPGSDYVWLNAGGIGSASNTQAINLNAALVILDPDGYLWKSIDWNLKCGARSACYGAAQAFSKADVLKSLPGTWKVLVVDKTANTLLLSQTLNVSTTVTVNQAPTATVSAAPGATLAQAVITLKVADAEKNKITVTWHPPGSLIDRDGDHVLDTYIRQQPGSDGVAQQTIDFSIVGTYTMFVELKDDSVRYGQGTGSGSAAGDGFSNLLQLKVNLPISGVAGGVTIVSAQHPAVGVPVNVAQARTLTATSTAAGGTTTAAFTAGATKDNGVTTATTFKSGDSVTISGAVQAQAVDVGQAAALFVVVVAPIGGQNVWLYRDGNGNYQPWNGAVADLKPAVQTDKLEPSTTLPVYTGPVPAGTILVFLGYKLANSATLHYSGSPLQLTVN